MGAVTQKGSAMARPEAWLFKFGQYMKLHGFSQRTIPNYLYNIRLFTEYLAELGITNLADADRKVLADYQLHVSLALHRGKRLAHITQRNRIICLKTFYRYLMKNGAAITDPTVDLDLPRVRDQLPANVLTKKEIARLLAQPDTSGPCGIRDRAILELLYSSGIRVSEMSGLNLEDLDLHGGELRVLGKGDKERLVPLGEVACDYVGLYLEGARPRLAPAEQRALFVTVRGMRFIATNVSALVREYGRRAGIHKRVTPHALRHTCATHLLKGKADIRQIQRILGHASIATTQRYTKVEITDLKEVLKRCHPRERKEIHVDDL
jgi:integrase/recombinase XerD